MPRLPLVLLCAFIAGTTLAGTSQEPRFHADTNTVSMLLYAQARGAPTPALNALATITLVITMLTLVLAYLVYRRFAGGDGTSAVAALGEA